ncbi:MAG: hypothetical protein ACQERC_04405 [Bacteroidota bacterium]
MKKVIYLTLISVFTLLISFSCTKEIVKEQGVSKQGDKELNRSNEDITNTKARQKGEIACSIYDENGDPVCAGTRCGTPKGNCGPKYTACECIEEHGNGSLPGGMTFEDFQEAWNNEETRSELEAEGYESRDER